MRVAQMSQIGTSGTGKGGQMHLQTGLEDAATQQNCLNPIDYPESPGIRCIPDTAQSRFAPCDSGVLT